MTGIINPFALVSGVITDPNFANVVLLAHFDGTNGATSFTDSSSAGHSISNAGSASLTTSQFKFGTASLDTSIAASSGAVVADSADWDFGSGQFTIEAWIRRTGTLSGVHGVVAQYASAASNLAFFFGFNAGAFGLFYSSNGTSGTALTASYTPTLNGWDFVAVDRDASNVIRVYTGASVLTSATVSATFFNSNRTLKIGNDESALRAFIGQIDDVRITKGVARYAGTCVVPTAAFPDS